MPTSKLQEFTGQQIKQRFSQWDICENTRPIWLISTRGERLELDFYIKRLGIAIEVQGQQHLKFIPFFHNTMEDYLDQVRRDQEKAMLCASYGTNLLYVYKQSDVWEILAKIHAATQPSVIAGWVKDDPYIPIHVSRAQANAEIEATRILQEKQQEFRRLVNILKNTGNISGKRRQQLRWLALSFQANSVLEWFANNKGAQNSSLPLGSYQTRRRGRDLKTVCLSAGRHLVLGGRYPHIVNVSDRLDYKTYSCDCVMQARARDNVCSHVFAVLWELVAPV